MTGNDGRKRSLYPNGMSVWEKNYIWSHKSDGLERLVILLVKFLNDVILRRQ